MILENNDGDNRSVMLLSSLEGFWCICYAVDQKYICCVSHDLSTELDKLLLVHGTETKRQETTNACHLKRRRQFPHVSLRKFK